jgi:hypothetical protein
VTTRGHLARIGAVAAWAGAPTLFVATLLHPMSADPNDAPAAFAEYAASTTWVATHLGQFLGVAMLGVALVGVAAAMEAGAAAAWARVGVLGTAASVATAAALQAVDGVALKAAVDRWARATGEARARAFEAAFAVRQVEIGAASLLSVLFGLTVSIFAVAMLCGRRFPPWLAAVGVVGGVATIAAGVAQAYTGFSALSMTLGMPASSVLLVWAVLVGVRAWRLAPSL